MKIIINEYGIVAKCDILIDATIIVNNGGKLVECLIRPTKELVDSGRPAIHLEPEGIAVGNVVVPEG
jgi:hypothetical protein